MQIRKEVSQEAVTSANRMGVLPENIKVYPYVDRLDVLSRADVFITHCGMNSVSESLYMAKPMILYPQTHEQEAVARRLDLYIYIYYHCLMKTL